MQTQHKEYGVNKRNQIQSRLDQILEELRLQGFSVIENLVDAEFLAEAKTRLDSVYLEQEKSFGREKLISIQELDVARCPLAYDPFFLEIASQKFVREVANSLIGGMHILHLQNGIINRPNEEHHQTSWHRDLPYQDYAISRPLSMGALWCIDPFNSETGATWVLPFSHQMATLPSLEYTEKFKIQINAPAGSVILFDSMLYHCAGQNKSSIVRRAINNVYVTPLIRQQIDIPALLNGKYQDNADYAELLGYTTQIAESVDQYRALRWSRLKK